MKKILLSVLVLATSLLNAQVINFPDPAFKAILLQADTDNNIAGLVKIDANNDGEIEQSEALAVYEISIPAGNIFDLTGIEYFTNLIYFSCIENNLQTVNLTSLTNLEILGLFTNQISSINLNGLNNLWFLRLEGNLLTEVDFSTLSALKILLINQNQLTHLDFSNNPLFEQLRCDENPNLNWVNIRNNHSQIFTQTPYNGCWDYCPNLTSICVDDNEVIPAQDFLSSCGITQPISIVTDCSLGINEENYKNVILWPNPTKEFLYVDNSEYDYKKISLFNNLGQKVINSIDCYQDKIISINLCDFSNGLYFLQIEGNKNNIWAKIYLNKE
ncbi:MAG TPA: T9SS type A sorting domain-containing protein [Flavobacterium lutivivi]|nr:T9SS type A sorting domain-containing protein [Flavobacterium lutivivi]